MRADSAASPDTTLCQTPPASRPRDEVRDKMLDKTLADSFPTSDPPSSIPDPSTDSFSSSEPPAAAPSASASSGVHAQDSYDRNPRVEAMEDTAGQPLPHSGPFDRAARSETAEKMEKDRDEAA